MTSDLIQSAIKVYLNPSPDNIIKLAKDTYSMMQEDTFQKVMNAVGEAHMKAAHDIIENFAYERDPIGAIQRILTHLEDAYQFYKTDYAKKTHVNSRFMPNAVSELAQIFNGSIESGKVLGEICVSIASYHYALGDDRKLVKEWAFNRLKSNGLEPSRYIDEQDLSLLIGKDDAEQYFEKCRKDYEAAMERERYESDDGNMPLGQHYGD